MNNNYNPKDFEKEIYKRWMDKKYFKASINYDKKPFVLVSPPPNITAKLHIGHGYNLTLQDILVRYKRMKGYEVLWIQGSDHAAIATEAKICDKLLKEEGKTKFDIGREAFQERVEEWYNQYQGIIFEQFKSMGVSPDWDRNAFTMDEKCSALVKRTFVDWFNKGYIYRGERITNWCPSCRTTISDDEIEYEENDGFLWHLKYKIKGTDKFLVLATTRPETLFGDTAVAVNPSDERYKDLVGKTVIVPICNREIPIIADNYVEKEFGTGAVKITPAHDPNDFEVGKRHNLPFITVIDKKLIMTSEAGEFAGLEKMECRKQLIDKLKELNLLEKIEKYKNNVGHCYRCHKVVEPLVTKQWYVRMKDIAKKPLEAAQSGELNFYPDRMVKVYNHYLNNIRDWCISRQLWTGHRMPLYQCKECGEYIANVETVTVCPKCGATNMEQETDVLDTWFSSGLWPISVLDYDGEEMQYFYPADVNVTAYDIIFFWVARMMFMCTEITGKIPFKDVLMHGLVRDTLGRKMSKSLGNGIDPFEMVDEFGTDATRLSLINSTTIGSDPCYGKEKATVASQFINKMWNASKFVLMAIKDEKILDIKDCNLSTADKWILKELNDFMKLYNVQMDKYEYGFISTILMEFFWNKFCDWYIELSKPNLIKNKQSTASVLYYVLSRLLEMFHPFIPFVTEEIYTELTGNETIMFNKVADEDEKFDIFENDKKVIDEIIEAVKSVRNVRIDKNIPDNKKSRMYILSNGKVKINEEMASYISKMAFGESVDMITSADEITENCIIIETHIGKIYLIANDLIDPQKEKERLEKDIEHLNNEILRSEKMLANAGFVAKAPRELIEKEKEKLNKNKALLEEVKNQLSKM